MDVFFQQRVRQHQKKIQRYLRYVFNDHFALTMTLLVGGMGLYYSNVLKTLPTPFSIGKFILIAFWLITLHVGRFASLTQLPDQVFLLPKEKQMRKYLAKALNYSLYFPLGVLFLTTAMSMPLVVVATGNVDFSQTLLFIGTIWGLKYSHLLIQRVAFFQEMAKQKTIAYSFWLLISTVILALSLWMTPILSMVLSVLQVLFFYQWLWLKMTASIDWEKLLNGEQTRLRRMYQFINLFTDVPEVQGQVKRRAAFDGLFSKIKYQQSNTALFLFSRHFVRGTEYSGLYLRLTLLGSLLLYFVNDFYFSIGIGSLFLYLIGFQLLPLAQRFRYVTTFQLYPIQQEQTKTALQQLLTVLLFVAAALFSVSALLSLDELIYGVLASACYFIVAILFTFAYVPLRLKMKKR
ncbi:ABC transporter [Enterococcus alcedinis]|uniref:ABC transporter n=1 Tax=Enterococcus alcedinis TaxID=1274384 RepID=A0A917JF75_9ENTE|nr:ABC transporter permease [Enterococcus alcedinis]MBP2102555.1 ABC-2 type transport system permease protein [Enterococcus alcedinis]GGI66113.1 ABC transporter [Enterococcus alcedinis]